MWTYTLMCQQKSASESKSQIAKKWEYIEIDGSKNLIPVFNDSTDTDCQTVLVIGIL